ncbi:MAG TPA: type II toxin-antitoxin system antitoxin SocA domain-containing protein [Stellaceae bacterium]|jgi:uncharacterized phage-associated protein|nr:type II toxin-antitoxin system antitoxin SocA domain-containing protein [Stellaceae bacterium]
MSIAAIDAAKRVCDLSSWTVTNLQLQKLLYIIHMVYAGRHNGSILIREPFEAWDYGPVIPSLYKKVKIFGNKPISDIFTFAKDRLPAAKDAIIREACGNLLSITPAQLVSIAHWQEGAWAKNYAPRAFGIQIPQKDIFDEYNKRVESGNLRGAPYAAAE